MPRKSLFVIALTREERAVLQRRVWKYMLPYFEAIRAQMILLVADGLQNDAIAIRLNA